MDAVYRIFGIRRGKTLRRQSQVSEQERKENDLLLEERREDPPPPPSKGDWTCDDPYRYSIKESPKDAWESCNDIVDAHDEDLCRGLKEEISFLLVVAGLFLAVVTAFTVESYKLIKPDKGEDLLVQVVRLLNGTDAQGSARLSESFVSDKRNVVVNQMWFLSITLSLIAVVFGTFCLQWISAFLRTDVRDKSLSPADALALRQLRFDGLVGWGVPQAPAILLLIVQASIVVFTIGLVYLLWGISRPAALPAVIVASIAGALLYLANLMPFLQPLVGAVFPATQVIPQCPYKSPASWILHHTCVLLTAPCLVPFRYFFFWHGGSRGERICDWMDRQRGLLTDYLWQRYDELCKGLRESSPQGGSSVYSHYLVRGITSAMSALVFEPNAVDIILSCLQALRSEFRTAETWESLFDTKLSRAEEALLRGDLSLVGVEGTENRIASAARIRHLKQDFLSAHVFQHLAEHSQKLRRVLHQHRIELYVRIKNSNQVVAIRANRSSENQSDAFRDGKIEDEVIGSSIDCPDIHGQDAQELPRDLKIQFLSCANRLIGTKRFRGYELLVTAVIIASEGGKTSSISRKRHSVKVRHESLLTTGRHPMPIHVEDPTITIGRSVEIGSPGRERVLRTGAASSSNVLDPMDGVVDGDSELLAKLCQEVRGKLALLSEVYFGSALMFWGVRKILDLDPEQPGPRLSGNDLA